jgi:hypothetical protein
VQQVGSPARQLHLANVYFIFVPAVIHTSAAVLGAPVHMCCFVHANACCRHILGGVEYSLELCTASSGLGGSLGGSLLKLGFGTVTKANSKEMAGSFVNERIRKALAAAHISSHVMTALQVSNDMILEC